ncbi:TPA: DUF262 domain-containing protein [Streptococcus equi subsp. zooepidemicus]|nr:DUF262 domain-containing protein [Streptococcus equi]MCD3385707.1 DUF262 domain-containing HNH endonuclease family protein [Streptococcus equi subsp. zooepidemicus]MCD3387630.1 DUF262 domain-containing HNH endonuclease family protein [Streptococcus equi subsp. zooepidemicus]MCD3388219.1 DUF262 domain-containing HNH endonuclease family protein [Streptococcus equi subsp. zooepidemicus]MCD3404448.1 DUF262 domain-containing HNH endonuclease family protein [Streptococcus equi subsp. zooepidemicus
MKFTPKDKRIEEIFSNRNRYEVPNFQRDFSWKNEQYTDFINDIKTSIGLRYDEKDDKIMYNSEALEYFFGTLLLVGDETKADVEKPYIVIDGQQRLTTMTLFLTAIKSIIDNYNNDCTKDQYSHVYDEKLVFDYTVYGKSEKKIRLVNKVLDPVLPFDILNIPPYGEMESNPSNTSQKVLLESYNIIREKLSKNKILENLGLNTNREWDDLEYIKCIDMLGQQLLNSTVICIYSVSSEDINTIYQNFNSKGLKLNDVDLIKSKLFEKLGDTHEQTSKLWSHITDTVHKIDDQAQDYFYYFFNACGISANKTKLFKTFSENYREDQYTDFLRLCSKYVDYYRIICKPEDSDTVCGKENYFNQDDNYIVKENLDILYLSGYSQFRMAFLSLFQALSDGKIKNKDFKYFVSLITNYNVLNSIKTKGDGSKTNTNTKVYRKISNIFRKEKINIADAKSEVKGLLDEVKPSKPSVLNSQKVFYTGQKDKSQNDTKARRLTKHILVNLEISRRRKTSENTANKALKPIYDYSIEHIIDKKDQVDNVLQIGNLILLEQSVHTSSTNKKKMYMKSEVHLIKDLLADFDIDTFNSKNIKQRQKDLLSEYYDFVTKDNMK